MNSMEEVDLYIKKLWMNNLLDFKWSMNDNLSYLKEMVSDELKIKTIEKINLHMQTVASLSSDKLATYSQTKKRKLDNKEYQSANKTIFGKKFVAVITNNGSRIFVPWFIDSEALEKFIDKICDLYDIRSNYELFKHCDTHESSVMNAIYCIIKKYNTRQEVIDRFSR
jgi:ribosomal protein S20